MNVTNIQLSDPHKSNSRMLCYVSVTFDHVFVVHNMRLIKTSGAVFLAMPSKKSNQPCMQCSTTNPSDARYCCQCGTTLTSGCNPVFHDICHPVNAQFRKAIETQVLSHYHKTVCSGVCSGFHGINHD